MLHKMLLVGLYFAIGMATVTQGEITKAAENTSPDSSSNAEPGVDEAAIRKTAETFIRAYGDADAVAVAEHFTPNAEIIDEYGNVLRGRDEIQKAFSSQFAKHPGSRVELHINSIRLVTPEVAVEEGIAIYFPSSGTPTTRKRYAVTHVKGDDGWLVASSRDLDSRVDSNYSHLHAFEWLIGDWSNADAVSNSSVVAKCRWSDNKNFLLREFAFRGQDAGFDATERIGWDPVTGTIRSWFFDSNGGVAEGEWHRNGEQWVITARGYSRDGQQVASTNVITPIDDNSYRWESRDRHIGGKPQPDISMTIQRRGSTTDTTAAAN